MATLTILDTTNTDYYSFAFTVTHPSCHDVHEVYFTLTHIKPLYHDIHEVHFTIT